MMHCIIASYSTKVSKMNDFWSGLFCFVVCTTSMEGDLVVSEIAQPPLYCTVDFMNFLKIITLFIDKRVNIQFHVLLK